MRDNLSRATPPLDFLTVCVHHGAATIPSCFSDASRAWAHFLSATRWNSSSDINGKNSFHFGTLPSQTSNLYLIHWSSMSGRVWTPSPAKQGQDTPLDGCKFEAEEKVPYRRPRLVKCWCVFNSYWLLALVDHLTDYLQARLTLETSQPVFSELPFRFAEVAKVILDV